MKLLSNDYKAIERLVKAVMRNFMPRQLILFIDSFLITIAAYLTFWLISTITGADFSVFQLKWELWAIVFLQVVFFSWVKSFAGLIRYSTLNDAWIQFKVVLLNVVTLLTINQI